MKLPLSWLKEYVHLTQSSAEIARVLTMAGIEVDAICHTPMSFDKVVVGTVLSVEKHPNADKLCVATVTDGSQTYQVVCGASNCRAGLKTAFAPVGATLTDETNKVFKIKNTKIRGVESFGMLCSEDELKISDTHCEGILELPGHLKDGTHLSEIFSDTIFETSITPNLGHCASVIGSARELAAAIGEPLRIPEVSLKEDLKTPTKDLIQVTIQDQENCPRYTARVIKNCKVGPSPDWLKKRIEDCGLRSINNIVDITNYILLETGHPLHAFDYDKIAGHKIIVRRANEGESFVTIDNKERLLTSENLLICDQDKAVALAGVMGGINSEVSDQTVNVLIESAYFRPANVRKTSKKLGLITDASKHFERGADPNNLIFALNRAASMVQELAQGQIAEGVVDIKEKEFPEKIIDCRLARVNSMLGTHLSLSEIEGIFRRLGFTVSSSTQDVLTVTVPTFRVDISGEIDLVEEVARIYGYDNIPRQSAKFQISQIPHAPIFVFEREVRARFIAKGLQEFLTCDLIGPTLLEMVRDPVVDPVSIIHVLNPTSIDQSILRPSMLPGLLQVVKYNVDHQNHHISGFEIGKIHYKKDDNYKEQSVVGVILTGHNTPHHWDQKPEELDFYDLKGIIEDILIELGIENVRFKENAISSFHTGRQAAVFVGTLAVGSFGEIHPKIQRGLDVPQRILYAELNLQDLFQVKKDNWKMTPLAIYPASERDWTITLSEETPISNVFDVVHAINSQLLEEVTLLDIYRSDKLGHKRINATFHFVYRDKEKTVAQEAVDLEHARVTKEVLSSLGKVAI